LSGHTGTQSQTHTVTDSSTWTTRVVDNNERSLLELCFKQSQCLFRRKFGARLAELESQLEAAKSKAARLEKEKSKLTVEIENVMINLDDVSDYCFSSHFCLYQTTTHTAVVRYLSVLARSSLYKYNK